MGGSAASMNKTFTTGLRPWENREPLLRAMEKRTPLVAGATTFAPVGSVSLDFRVTAFPYKSSSLATPQAGAQQPVIYFVPLMR